MQYPSVLWVNARPVGGARFKVRQAASRSCQASPDLLSAFTGAFPDKACPGGGRDRYRFAGSETRQIENEAPIV
jgi:hypothetical protein